MVADTSYHGPVFVFDLDDTLYPESDYAISGYHAISKALPEALRPDSIEVMTAALQARSNPMDALAALLSERSLEQLIDIAEWVRIYRTHIPKINTYPDVMPVLNELRRRGVHMGLVTDGRSLTQRNKIKALGLEPMFHPDDIYISEETGHPKPASNSFISVVHRYPEASMFIYVGDNPAKDFIAPQMLGWVAAMRLSDGRNVYPQTAETPPDIIRIHTFADLLKVDTIQNAFMT